LAAALRSYLAGRSSALPLWPGTWTGKAAEMLGVDLAAAGVPYVVEGPDGPLHADFHSLRHGFIAMLDRSGAMLKEAMQLARHSDPKLTMAVYGRA
jgi:integrase